MFLSGCYLDSFFCGRYMASPPTSLAAIVQLCQQIQGPQAPRAVAVLKLLNKVIIYSLWRERGMPASSKAYLRLKRRSSEWWIVLCEIGFCHCLDPRCLLPPRRCLRCTFGSYLLIVNALPCRAVF